MKKEKRPTKLMLSKAQRRLLAEKLGDLTSFSQELSAKLANPPGGAKPVTVAPRNLEKQLKYVLEKGACTPLAQRRMEVWFETDFEKILGGDESPVAAFAKYFDCLAGQCATIVAGSVPNVDHRHPPRLASVFIELRTQTRKPGAKSREDELARGEDHNLSVLEALFGVEGQPLQARTVITGKPGSGKSTCLQYICLCLADPLSAAPPDESRLRGHEAPAALVASGLAPLRVILGDFHREIGDTADSSDVLAYLERQLTAAGCGDCIPLLPDLLRSGDALLLFDGLDEVPGARLAAVRSAIQSVAEGAFGAGPIVVTCRSASYRQPLPGFAAAHEIAPLTRALRADFIDAWYAELAETNPAEYGESGPELAATLKLAVEQDRLAKMAENPFFLTAMAALHRRESELPDKDAVLMNELVDRAMAETGKTDPLNQRKSELQQLLGEQDPELRILRRCLERVAFRCRDEQPSAGGRFNLDFFKSELAERFTLSPPQVKRVRELLTERAGLLESQADGDRFAYRFEEFLAAVHLNDDDFWEEAEDAGSREFCVRTAAFHRRHCEAARQILIWTAGYSAHKKENSTRVAHLILELLPDEADQADPLAELDLPLEMACDARLPDGDKRDAKAVRNTVKELRDRFRVIFDDVDGSSPAIRSRAGTAIGRLRGAWPGLRFTGTLEEFAWAPVGDEAFEMGDDDMEYRGNPRFRCDWIKRPFRITRYPVTFGQYEAFVKAGGYRMGEEIWGRQGIIWRDENSIAGPESYAAVYQTPNHPRVGVSWHEANAYCRWLSRELGATIRLPTEAEWERAARGTMGRKFPWGDEDDWQQRCANYDTGPRTTSPVGLFVAGDTPDGRISDLAGNVWEWCHTVWRDRAESAEENGGLDDAEAKGSRVLRGGSWIGCRRGSFLCARRGSSVPDARRNLIGFRCVCES